MLTESTQRKSPRSLGNGVGSLGEPSIGSRLWQILIDVISLAMLTAACAFALYGFLTAIGAPPG